MPQTNLLKTMALLLAGALISACGGNSPSIKTLNKEGFSATIKRTANGIPHIQSDSFKGLGYGYGYIAATDNICKIADFYVTVNGERSKYFGPETVYPFPANLIEFKNSDSDFFFKLIHARGKVEELMATPAPTGPSEEIKDLFRGHIAGYNRYIREVGVDNISDPNCRGADWVREIGELDTYRMAYTLGVFAGWAPSAGGIGSAQPVDTPLPNVLSDFIADLNDPEKKARIQESLQPSMASNAVAIGKEASENGRGILLGNPHQGWIDSALFYQVHMTIPGKFDLNGTSFLGLPFVVIGSTKTMAWSHTTSAAFRFIPVQLQVLDSYSYLVDGIPEPMTPWPLEIEAKGDDGELSSVQRTLYTTRYGPMVTNIAGLDVFAWTPVTGFSMIDPNSEHMRYLNHFVEIGDVKNVHELKALLENLQGVPWANTVAADANGETLYADITVIANVPDDFAISCGSAAGVAAVAAVGLPILDGSRSSCMPGDDDDAAQPGIMGISKLPSLIRDDFVQNSNDSYWLTNPAEPLEGYARVLGDENTERRLRTRMGLTMISERLAGSDSIPNTGFTHEKMQEMMYNARHYLGEIWLDDLVQLCQSLSLGALGSSGPVDVAEACPILAKWDRTDNLDSAGALLFRRVVTRLLGTTLPSGTTTQTRIFPTSGFLMPFNPNDPINTPSGLNIARPDVQQALADAVKELRDLDIPLDALLRDHQWVERNGERIPLHGGVDRHGLFSIINVNWDPEKKAYANPYHGNTYTQVVSFDGSECPRLSTSTTYSQSQDPTSPWHNDQTHMYSNKLWVDVPFCAKDVDAQAISSQHIAE